MPIFMPLALAFSAITQTSPPHTASIQIDRTHITLLSNSASTTLCKFFPYEFRTSKKSVFIPPSEEDLLEIQKRLPVYIKHSRPDIFQKWNRYFFQIVCIQEGKERTIFINAFVKLDFSTFDLTQPVVVDDGGNSFWRICYSCKSKSFSGLSVNGVA